MTVSFSLELLLSNGNGMDGIGAAKGVECEIGLGSGVAPGE